MAFFYAHFYWRSMRLPNHLLEMGNPQHPEVTPLTTRTPWQVFACMVGMIISSSAGLSSCKSSGSWSCGFSSGEDVNTQDIGIRNPHDHFRPKQYHTVSLVWTLWGKTAGTCPFKVSPFDFQRSSQNKDGLGVRVYTKSLQTPCHTHPCCRGQLFGQPLYVVWLLIFR